MVERGIDIHRRGGVTLVEVMVALGLVAVSLMLILGLIPAGITASQRASDIQSAAAWSRQLLEETSAPSTLPIPAAEAESTHELQIGPTVFTATRRLKVTGPYLFRTEVETRWRAGIEPITMSVTRFNPDGPNR